MAKCHYCFCQIEDRQFLCRNCRAKDIKRVSRRVSLRLFLLLVIFLFIAVNEHYIRKISRKLLDERRQIQGDLSTIATNMPEIIRETNRGVDHYNEFFSDKLPGDYFAKNESAAD